MLRIISNKIAQSIPGMDNLGYLDEPMNINEYGDESRDEYESNPEYKVKAYVPGKKHAVDINGGPDGWSVEAFEDTKNKEPDRVDYLLEQIQNQLGDIDLTQVTIILDDNGNIQNMPDYFN